MPESVETPAPVSAARRWPASTSTTSAREPAVIGKASGVVLTGPPYDADSEAGPSTRYPSRRGSVSERPKEHASKACVGESPPWVQIPPAPPYSLTAGPLLEEGPFLLPASGRHNGAMRHTPRYIMEDLEEVKRLIRRNAWATFVSPASTGLVASHYPVILDDDAEGEDIVIISHFGRPDEVAHELG